MTDWTKVLRALAPQGRSDIVAAVAVHADGVFARYRINSALRQAHFLAHVTVESAGLTKLEENLSYSAARLCVVWPRRFPTQASAEPYAFNPKKLAEKVYGGRMGNTTAGDGFLFRGHGLLQETGRENTTALSHHLGIPVEQAVQWLVDPSHMLECACARFVMNGCLPPADRDDIEASTTKINGGLTGLSERKAALAVAKRALSASTPNPFGGLARVGFFSADDDAAPTEDMVRSAQARLKDLGYFPGAIDGDMGGATRGALAAFQTDHHIPVTSDLDAETTEVLGSSLARKRPIANARANATVDDLRDAGSETIAAADDAEGGLKTKTTGALAGVGLAGEAIGQLSDVKDWVSTLPDLVQWALTHPLLIALFVAGVVIWFERRSIRRALDRVRRARLDDHTSFRNAGR